MRPVLNKLLKIMLMAISLFTLNSGAAEKEQIDVLFLYSPAVAEHYNGSATTRINHIIENTNAIYNSSNLAISINPVEIQQFDIDDNISPYTLMGRAKSSQEIASLRDELGADLVVIYRLYKSGEPCGLGYRPATLDSKWIGISYVAVNCAAYKTAHEIGHNMGLGHSYAQGSKAFLKYARGHGVEGKFSTIMAYSSAYHAPKVYKFSSPDYKCKNISCGIKEGNKGEADAVKALKQTAPIVANLRKIPDVAQCDAQQIETFSKVENAYQTQKSKLENIDQQLATLEAIKSASEAHYQQVLSDYKKMTNDRYYPAQKLYQKTKLDFTQQLSYYRKGTISRAEIITTYFRYRDARKQLVSTYSEVKVFYTTTYLAAYKSMTTTQSDLAQLQKSQKVEKNIMVQLEKEYNEAKAIYQCA